MTGNDRAVGRLLGLVRDGDRLYLGTGTGEPSTLIRMLVDQVLPVRRDVEMIQVSVGGGEAIAAVGRSRGHRVRFVAAGGTGAKAVKAGEAEFVPASMAMLMEALEDGTLPIDGAIVAGVRTASGHISPGLSMDLNAAAVRAARFCVLELNAALPATVAEPWIEEADCDLVIETDVAPKVFENHAPSDAQRRIGELVAGLIPDGSIVEIGVGAGLQGVADALIRRGPDFRIAIHTGLITDDVMRLHQAGRIAVSLACCGGTSIVATAARGSAAFYRWLSGHDAVRMVGSDRAHRIRHLASLDRFIAINSAAEIDLLGNVGSKELGGVFGGGGLPDYATAGAHSAGSIIALESRDRHGRSKIFPTVKHVQLHGSLVTHLVTEHGVASLRNATPAERAERIAAVAHPDDRQALRDAWSRI